MDDREIQSIPNSAGRKQTEETLREGEQLFQSILENAQIGISYFNVDGHVVFTNRAFQQMLGYNEKELGDGSMGRDHSSG